jgi:hypothetical protein
MLAATTQILPLDQNQPTQTETSLVDVTAQRTIWYWDVASDVNDEDDGRKTLGEVFFHVTPKDALETLQKVASQSLVLDMLSVDDVMRNPDDVSPVQASTF